MGKPGSHAHTPLFACLALLGFALPQVASAVNVGRCGDMVGKGGYTLRQAIANAADGDTVDLTTVPVTCSTITLTGGEIPVAQTNLTIHGSAAAPITINAGNNGRVFEHTGSGLLNVYGVVLTNGNGVGGNGNDGKGGCLRSSGSVLLQYATVTGCTAATGGGVYTGGSLSLIHATISASSIYYQVGRKIVGGAANSAGSALVSYSTISGNYSQLYTGGIYAKGAMTVNHSVVAGNSANFSNGIKLSPVYSGYPRCTALAGGAGMTLVSSTVESNSAQHSAADPGSQIAAVCSVGILTTNYSTLAHNSGFAISVFPNSAFLTNSTLSGNGGAIVFKSNVTLHNSTLAFNDVGVYGTYPFFPSSCILTSVSTIAADTADAASEFDLRGTCNQMNSANNLIGVSPGSAGLTPLAFHGGPAKTHALLAGSPAIDAGTNPEAKSYDQRGFGYSRFVALAPDIGAYERQLLDDELFYGGFD